MDGGGRAPGLERGAGVRSLRTLIRGVRVTRVPVVVRGRLLIRGTRAVSGLQHGPGFGVELPEAVRPGDLRAERRFLPSAGALVRVASWPWSVPDRTARGLIRMGTLRCWPSSAISSRRTAPHIPGHSPVCRTAGQ